MGHTLEPHHPSYWASAFGEPLFISKLICSVLDRDTSIFPEDSNFSSRELPHNHLNSIIVTGDGEFFKTCVTSHDTSYLCKILRTTVDECGGVNISSLYFSLSVTIGTGGIRELWEAIWKFVQILVRVGIRCQHGSKL